MKKIALLFLIVLLLCAIVTVGFYYITQRGFLAREVYVYNGKSVNPVQLIKTDESSENMLLEAIKTNKKMINTNPNSSFLDDSLLLQVVYWPDIVMNYEISYNRYSGIGAIKKGLFQKSLYIIPDEITDYILSPESISIINTNGGSEPQAIDSSEYFAIIHDLTYLGGKPESLINPSVYEMSVETLIGTAINYDIYIDMTAQLAYINTPHGYYSMSENSTKTLMSLENIYIDYQTKMQPYPEIFLLIGSIKTPGHSEINWTRVKPSGEIVSETLPSSYLAEVESISPGQKIEANYKPDEKPDAIVLYEYKNGELSNEFDLISEDVYVPDFEGDLKYSLKAIYEHTTSPDSYGTINYDYSFLIDLPAQASIKYSQVRPGDILAFYVKYADEGETFSLESNLGNFKADFMPYGDSMMLYMPVNWWTSPKDYSATIYKNTDSTKEVFSTYKITILPDDFETIYQQLVVSEELAQKADPVNTANDTILVKEAKSHSNKTSYLDGLFIMPLNGALGTSYAQTRYINGENPYRHSGLDIDGDTGDPIIAANRGEVVFAGELVRTGNTVIIDHGMELFSSYLHMSEIDVKAGDFVEKGDMIGKVGSTGFSTGPHLHWSITLYGNYMSPLWLVENSLIPD